MAPAGTPPEIVAKLNAETAKILRDPKMIDTFNGRGVRLVGNSVAEFTAFIPKERARWAEIVKSVGSKDGMMTPHRHPDRSVAEWRDLFVGSSSHIRKRH